MEDQKQHGEGLWKNREERYYRVEELGGGAVESREQRAGKGGKAM